MSIAAQHIKVPAKHYHATGGDKTAIASVYMFKGTGIIKVNDKDINQYLPRDSFKMRALQPLVAANMLSDFDCKITVKGSGCGGQADAIRLAIAKALVSFDDGLKSVLRGLGLLTRDKRKVERKKCGLRKARKKEQYSKR